MSVMSATLPAERCVRCGALKQAGLQSDTGKCPWHPSLPGSQDFHDYAPVVLVVRDDALSVRWQEKHAEWLSLAVTA